MREQFFSFFISDEGQSSMSKLLMFLSFMVSSLLLFVDTILQNEVNESLLTTFILVYSGNYLVGKGIDKVGKAVRKKKNAADNP